MADPEADSSFRLTFSQLRSSLICRTQFYNIVHNVEPTGKVFASSRERILASYKLSALECLTRRASSGLLEFSQTEATIDAGINDEILFDCEDIYLADGTLAESATNNMSLPSYPCRFTPVLFQLEEKLDSNVGLLLALAAIGIACKLGALPRYGLVCYGQGYKVKTVNLCDHLIRAKQIIREATRLLTSNARPRLELNRSCPTCDYRAQCHAAAVLNDDVALMSTLTDKDRSKLATKGITTIAQLSYGYRPRRKKGPRKSGGSVERQLATKFDPRLKALAIKKNVIHVVGRPEFSHPGTPVYIDVEGIPDRRSYYLIGLRYRLGEEIVEQSYWADTDEDEREIWVSLLRALEMIDQPCLFHYGSYEKQFFRRMSDRYPEVSDLYRHLDCILESSINLLTALYSQIYFPTFSNGLKDIGRFLGFKWLDSDASGGLACLWRQEWETSRDPYLKHKLAVYNAEDCRATEVVAGALQQLCTAIPSGETAPRPSVKVEDLAVPYQRTYGKFVATIPQFQAINQAAYWDYQRAKVYVRSDNAVKAALRRQEKSSGATKPIIDRTVIIQDDRPNVCPHCGCTKIWLGRGSRTQTILDLKYTRSGIKRENSEYHFKKYKCVACQRELTSRPRTSKFGPGLRAWVIYQIIELRMSNQKISDLMSALFGSRVDKTAVNAIKSSEAALFMPLYEVLRREIVCGASLHVDETKGVVFGGGHYIWVFSTMSSVLYAHSPSRDGKILEDTLGQFNGVLISDFYGAYDSVDCPQQRCLIHLMRDINEDLVKHPFNEELSQIATQFGSLLRNIVETIDKAGLKKYYLRKHKKSVETFFNLMSEMKCLTDVALALQKRIGKNRDRLFTFLDYDGVPWNNNNAEHAVRAFTRLRNVMVTSTAKGTEDYCILLSIQQTLKYRNFSFLDFLKSGDRTLAKWSDRRDRSDSRSELSVPSKPDSGDVAELRQVE